ncbi:hypothetical protein CR513_50526, partial [Mucuna pruriens]
MTEDNLVSSYRLNNRNYLQWAQYIRTTLKGRKKLSNIEGNDLSRDDPKFEAWDDENSLIMTWLWNSMTPEINRNYMFYCSIREIWKNLIETYSMKKDFVAFYDIERKIFNSRQGILSVTEYYETLNSEETRRSVMLDKGNSNIGFAMVTGKGPTKRSTSEGKPFTKSSHGEYCTYCKQSGHTKDTCYKCYGKEKVLE